MKYRDRHTLRLTVCLMCFLLLGLSFLVMPIEGTADTQKYLIVLPGILFWGSLIGGIVSYILFASGVKKQIVAKDRCKEKVGLIAFLTNRYAVAVDITMMISGIATIAFMLLTDGSAYLCYLLLALFVWSFSMHCVCNAGVFNRWLLTRKGGWRKKCSCTKGR